MFTDKFTTKKDTTDLLVDIEAFSSLLFDTHHDFQQKLNHVFSERWNTPIQEFLSEQKVDTSDPSQVGKVLRELREQLLTLPTVVVELAIDPTPEMVKMIRNWFTELNMPTTIIDIKVSPGLVGGMRITSNGKYRDYSVKRYLEEHKKQKLTS